MEADQPSLSSSVVGPHEPSSPKTSPVRLSDFLGEALRFVLSASLLPDGPHLVLSRDYCSRLLEDEPTEPDAAAAAHPIRHADENFDQGVPAYPLYKRLARALERCIVSGRFEGPANSMVSVPVDYEFLESKKSEWNRLISNKGTELLKMLRAVEFELHVQEPFFSQLKAGMKTVEGRCAVGDYNRISPGSLILFNKVLLLKVQVDDTILLQKARYSMHSGYRSNILVETNNLPHDDVLQYIAHYSTFSEMLQMETLANVLPGVETIEGGVQIYRKFYTVEKEISNGVLAIFVSKLASQPYDTLADLLSGLHYEGIASLLGMAHTTGTIANELPPPRTFLISSSMKPTRPTVKGCSLTDAARALAKHVNRCSDGWWGDCRGSDSNKNMLALKLINHLLTNCSWMNIHLVEPCVSVFEIRVPEGYGARWSKDGLKFIGFLEPYTEEGFSNGWKH